MKKLILLSAWIFIASAIIAGCGEKPADPSAQDPSQLTASDLARLMDFHAWKVLIPQAQQPVKCIRIVIVKRDGTVVEKFGTGNNLGPEPCSSVLLGFRVEQGIFKGHLLTRDSKGGGVGWDLSFADALADSTPAWTTPGAMVWTRNRVTLAQGMKEGAVDGSILAIELVK